MQNTKLYSLTLIALGAAIIAVLSPLSIPIGIVPVTLQTLAVGLVATVLKARETFFAILLYLLLGFIGITYSLVGHQELRFFWPNRWFF